MEEGRSLDQRSLLIEELIRGKELAKQLLNHLHPSIPLETQEYLLDRILGCFNQGISLANLSMVDHFFLPHAPASVAGIISPGEDNSTQDIYNHHQHHKQASKKRKAVPRWSEQIRVGSGTRCGLEGPLVDGYSWRKYGQKDILGANFPRGYYRCTHRYTQGCLATKQVQRSNDDPTVVQVMYRGHHTCKKSSHHPAHPPLPPPAKLRKTEAEPAQLHPQQLQLKEQNQLQLLEEQNQLKQIELPNYASEQSVKTEEQLEDGDDHEEDAMLFPSFSFISALVEPENMENYVMGSSSFSPAFISPSTSESNYFPASPSRVNGNAMGLNVQTSESDMTEAISAPDSVTNSPIGGFDFSLDQLGIDPNFPFDDPEFSLFENS
ncbi:hypothetical protein Ancab_037976 [Ancistrocladus abbreviatus]